ncbi:conserved hypothetical signal peptide protein [Sinorhizobium sojae CCBAU 05684]|uniref:Conserved hypothetical signal peptide protein n=1 Tax=Sinorhizobium sojae CCBAU 05684 TaxID=716928 RepID=A0A249P764_9HYPH|nr:hypothetical protein [Sinorhizobium sojae]ASY61666.1 conserved hypothetical signal peptide protein [Sinorhizobium sojae CCBAU 05684]
MKTIGTIFAVLATVAGQVGTAAADPWKDESGRGGWLPRYEERPGRYYRERRYQQADKEEYRRGNCKIERKWDKDEYKEEIKCKRGRRAPAYYDVY